MTPGRDVPTSQKSVTSRSSDSTSPEIARRHAAALIDSEGVLGGVGLDVDSVLLPLLDIAVPEFCDWISVEVIDDLGGGTTEVLRHLSAEHSDRPGQLSECCKPSLAARLPGLDSLRHRVLQGESRGPGETDDRPWGLVVGLNVNNDIVGTIAFVRDADRADFERLDFEAAIEMSENTGRAIERMRLRRDAREAVRRTQRIASQLHQLIAASFTVNALSNEQEIAANVASSAQSVFNAESAVVSLSNGHAVNLRALARRSKRTVIVETDVIDQYEHMPSFVSGKTAPWIEGDWLIAPILENHRQAKGIVGLRREEGAHYGPEDMELLTLLAQTASTALSAAAMSRTIQNSEARWRALVEAAPVGIVEVDQANRVRWWNKTAARIFAWPVYSSELREYEPPIPESARSQLKSLWTDVQEGDATIGREVLDVEIGDRRRDLTVSAVVLPRNGDASPPGILTLVDDVTDTRQMKTEIRHAHRMEIRGQVASNLAHDFNNLLTLVSGYAEMLAQNLEADPKSLQMVSDIQSTVARASGLTSQLLSIGRTQPTEPVILDAAAALHSNAEVLERILGPEIELVWTLKPSSGSVIIDADQFEQMILNLAINARDAMALGGQLSIGVEPISIGPDSSSSILDPGQYVRITVSDTGHGMDEQTRLKCFEPMFTTKGPFKGSGLGLAAARRLVEGSGGSIQCQSEVGVGTIFEILLPRLDHTPEETPSTASIPDSKRPATILLADDEEHIRRLISQILRRNGYEVIEAGSGERALELAVEQDDDIDLLVSDVKMPSMSGVELAMKLQATNPRLGVLLMSGSESEGILDGLAPGTSQFLAKPFRPSELVERIHQLLNLPG